MWAPSPQLGQQWTLMKRPTETSLCHLLPKNICDLSGRHTKLTSTTNLPRHWSPGSPDYAAGLVCHSLTPTIHSSSPSLTQRPSPLLNVSQVSLPAVWVLGRQVTCDFPLNHLPASLLLRNGAFTSTDPWDKRSGRARLPYQLKQP